MLNTLKQVPSLIAGRPDWSALPGTLRGCVPYLAAWLVAVIAETVITDAVRAAHRELLPVGGVEPYVISIPLHVVVILGAVLLWAYHGSDMKGRPIWSLLSALAVLNTMRAALDTACWTLPAVKDLWTVTPLLGVLSFCCFAVSWFLSWRWHRTYS